MAIIATAIIFLLFLLASCKSKQQVITEHRCSESLEVNEVAAVQSTAKATSSTLSLQELFSNLSLNIDSIVITKPPELSNGYGENVSEGSAFTPGTPHDHPPCVGMAEGCAYGDTAYAPGVAAATHSAPLKTATIPSLPTERISPNNTRHNNVPYNGQQGKIVISGISLNRQSAQCNTDITASSDTATEVRMDKSVQTSVKQDSIQRVEGKPRSKSVWKYAIVILTVIAAAILLMKKFHFFTFIAKAIRKLL